jgi:nicotinamidase/pyrazinamidase
MARDALLLVDIQNDFCPGGALAVPEGDRIVPIANWYARLFERRGLPVFASRDWHPAETRHFVSGGGVWPPHCVQGTWGAELHARLSLPADAVVVSKGMDPDEDAYSAFQAQTPGGKLLGEELKELGVERLFVGGLATDYCVRASVLDALRSGLRAVVLEDAVKGIDLSPGDIARAVAEMEEHGARTASLHTVEMELAG